MLTDLHIKDVVIIENLVLDFARGFSSLTGETGAGKSIILDALGLSLGQRSEARLVRQGADQASVTATFDVIDKAIQKKLAAIMAENDLACDWPLILRRTLLPDGRSKAFLNDQPVSIGFLKTIGEQLVEIHGQFETQKLLDPKTHGRMLDVFGALEKDVRDVQAAWAQWQKAERDLRELIAALERAQRDQDYWMDSARELRELNPEPGEEDRLVEQRSVMMHAEKILHNMNDAQQALTAHTGAKTRLNTALKNLERVQDKLPEQLVPLIDGLNKALFEIDDVVDALERTAHDLAYDQNAQSTVDQRLFALRAAARKYQVAVANLPEFLNQLEEKLSLIQDQTAQKKKLESVASESKKRYRDTAEILHQKRLDAAGKLSAAVMTELTPLKLEKATFLVSVEKKLEENWGSDGMDQVIFLISTNPGMAPGTLNKIASGGEMARFMLALKVVTQEAEATPTLIFDEVDTGVGGAVAEAVGLRLKQLGNHAQVFAVTHSPQVAAKGHQHLRIAKQNTNGMMRTHVTQLSPDERIEEIARMLSGKVVTAEARAAAANLVDVLPTEKASKKTAVKTKRTAA